jgi:hypothetical protein
VWLNWAQAEGLQYKQMCDATAPITLSNLSQATWPHVRLLQAPVLHTYTCMPAYMCACGFGGLCTWHALLVCTHSILCCAAQLAAVNRVAMTKRKHVNRPINTCGQPAWQRSLFVVKHDSVSAQSATRHMHLPNPRPPLQRRPHKQSASHLHAKEKQRPAIQQLIHLEPVEK